MKERPEISTDALEPFMGKFIRLGVPNLVNITRPFYYYGKILSKDNTFLTFEHHKDGQIQLIAINTILDISTVLPEDRRRRK